jgi:hypothetical protein
MYCKLQEWWNTLIYTIAHWKISRNFFFQKNVAKFSSIAGVVEYTDIERKDKERLSLRVVRKGYLVVGSYFFKVSIVSYPSAGKTHSSP